MIEDDLTPSAQGALDALRSGRGPCPPAETLVEYEALAPEARSARPEHAHVVVCSRCQLVVLHLAEPKPAASSLRWALPLAAAAVLAVGVSLIDWQSNGGTPPETIRGAEIQAIAPAGAVDEVTEFSWQSPAPGDRYRVSVRRGSDLVWQSTATTTRVAPPANVFERGVEYRWQVELIDREGEVRMASPPQPFTLRAP